MQHSSGPVVLCILDGWGYREAADDNAISSACTPTWDRLRKEWPSTLLQASEHYVGLPEGQMGNSEVGHTNLGAGRIIYQDLPRINQAIRDDTLKTNPHLNHFIETLRSAKGRCHLLGLFSPGGVHSHQDHIMELIKILKAAEIPVILHPFLDGRDTSPQSALDHIQDILKLVKSCSLVKFGTVSGRYYAMDRDKRWDRIEKAYEAIVRAYGQTTSSVEEAIQESYRDGILDEFVEPRVIESYGGMEDRDGLLMANFRADRARQILEALVLPHFSNFERTKTVNFSAALGMTEYSTLLNEHLECLFPAIKLNDGLGEIISRANGKQLRIAETEKYAHVTFFFNGGRETPFAGEERILIASPPVATYDHQPEMSAYELTDRLIQELDKTSYTLVVVNYANTDMVGHSGDQRATQKAVETVDHCLNRLERAVLNKNGTLIITADHGNAEMMFDPKTQTTHTAHTCNPVPFILISKTYKNSHLRPGKLADVAPTILKILGLQNSTTAMTGTCLIK